MKDRIVAASDITFATFTRQHADFLLYITCTTITLNMMRFSSSDSSIFSSHVNVYGKVQADKVCQYTRTEKNIK
jgi:hypothetical protein